MKGGLVLTAIVFSLIILFLIGGESSRVFDILKDEVSLLAGLQLILPSVLGVGVLFITRRYGDRAGE